MLTLFVTLAIIVVGDDLARRGVTAGVSQDQSRDLARLSASIQTSWLGLSVPHARDEAAAIAAKPEFESAVRRALARPAGADVRIYSLDGERIFGSGPGSGVARGASAYGGRAFEQARREGSASALVTTPADGRLAERDGNSLTTFVAITAPAPAGAPNGAPVMIAALTADVSGELASAQRTVWLTAGTFAAGMLIVLCVVHWVSERSRQRLRRSNVALAAQYAAVRESRERMVNAADATKRAIAEELHGTVQTKLFAVWMRMSDLRTRMPALPEPLAREMDGLIGEVDRIREEDIRGLSHRLHPSIVRVSAGAGLRSLCDFYKGMVPVELKVGEAVASLEPAGMSDIPEHVRLGVYRIAELALGNVARHAKARSCRVNFDYDAAGASLVLTIEDDGQGFDLNGAPSSGMGMVNMTDYADALGGRLTVVSEPGKGTRVGVEVPFVVAPRRNAIAAMAAADRVETAAQKAA